MTQEARKKKFNEWLKLLDIYKKYVVQWEVVYGEQPVSAEQDGGGLGSNPPPPPPPPPVNP